MDEPKINIKHYPGLYILEVNQYLPIKQDKAWDFFSDPENLEKITPKKMGFRITSLNSGKMYPGMIISYKIGIFPCIKSGWITEITQVKEKEYFIDEQRFGPYTMWHHEHHFKETGDGVIMADRVSYRIPLGIIGRVIHWLFIKGKLINIFSYRSDILKDYLGNK